jgi:hypothetical protein
VRHVRLGLATLGALCLGACNAILGIGDFTVAGDGQDGGPPGDGNQVCLGTLVPVCFDDTVDKIDLPLIVDTGSASDCPFVVTPANGSSELCVITARTIDLSGHTLRAVGPRPLVIAAIDTITITNGNIDVSSPTGPGLRTGAGADAFECGVQMNGTPDDTGAGGGAGGSFGASGGPGASGSNGSAGAQPGMKLPIETLHGGCAGTSGGAGAQTVGGVGGHGGGAVYLVAGTLIMMDGSSNVFAAGGGGGGGAVRAGGGGGGSGGMIALEAPTVQVDCLLAANGAGGGGGSNTGTGDDGKDGTQLNFMSVAAGGAADMGGGGGGGAGSTATLPDGSAGFAGPSGSGGGGGGAVGVIWLRGDVNGPNFRTSPSPFFAP